MYFLAIYVILSMYFASLMVRLLLVLSPAVAIASGIGLSSVARNLAKSIRSPTPFLPKISSIFGLIIVTYLCSTFIFHGTIMGSEVYSNPSVVLPYRTGKGLRKYYDDFREAY